MNLFDFVSSTFQTEQKQNQIENRLHFLILCHFFVEHASRRRIENGDKIFITHNL